MATLGVLGGAGGDERVGWGAVKDRSGARGPGGWIADAQLARPLSRVELFERIRRDREQEGLSIRALAMQLPRFCVHIQSQGPPASSAPAATQPISLVGGP